jgi:hypothetical protein
MQLDNSILLLLFIAVSKKYYNSQPARSYENRVKVIKHSRYAQRLLYNCGIEYIINKLIIYSI